MTAGDGIGEAGGSSVRIGRYECKLELLHSSLGSVWGARVASGAEMGRSVHVRRIGKGTLDEEAVHQLTTAGFTAMEVRDPKVLAVLDVVAAEGEVAVVSEQVDGIRLRALLEGTGTKRPHCAPHVAMRVAMDVAEALQAARILWEQAFAEQTDDDLSMRAYIHGGVLPDFVLLATYGDTMLTDVGVAGVISTLPLLAEHPDVLPYRAPEQFSGIVDQQTDVFMIGIWLWELIANRPLFGSAFASRLQSPQSRGFAESTQLSTIRRKVQTAPIPRLDSLPKWQDTVPQGIADIVARALERERGRRFQSLGEFIGACRALAPGLIASPDDVGAFVRRAGGELERAVHLRQSDPPVSDNRPTRPPTSRKITHPPGDDALIVDERSTKVPALPGKPAQVELTAAPHKREPADTLREDALMGALPERITVDTVPEPVGQPARSAAPANEPVVVRPPPFPKRPPVPPPRAAPVAREPESEAPVSFEPDSGPSTLPRPKNEAPPVAAPAASYPLDPITLPLMPVAKPSSVRPPPPAPGSLGEVPVSALEPEAPSDGRRKFLVIGSVAAVAALVGFAVAFGGPSEESSETPPPANQPPKPPEPVRTAEPPKPVAAPTATPTPAAETAEAAEVAADAGAPQARAADAAAASAEPEAVAAPRGPWRRPAAAAPRSAPTATTQQRTRFRPEGI